MPQECLLFLLGTGQWQMTARSGFFGKREKGIHNGMLCRLCARPRKFSPAACERKALRVMLPPGCWQPCRIVLATSMFRQR
jgi:hypothetical protein